MAQMKTSEIINALQECVAKYGDLPFEVRDSDNGIDYVDVGTFADTVENGGCCDETDAPVIGIRF